MAPFTGRLGGETPKRRTAAQWYCLLGGIALLLAGLLGFIADASFETGEFPSGEVEGSLFLGFEVNGWHNLVHLASGLLLLAAANTRPSAKGIALAFGAVYGIVALIGLVDGSDVLALLPVNGADNVLHIGLSVLGIVAGVTSPALRRHKDKDEHKGRHPKEVAATSGEDRSATTTGGPVRPAENPAPPAGDGTTGHAAQSGERMGGAPREDKGA